MNKRPTIISILTLCFCMVSCGDRVSQELNPIDYVDPFIATCGDPDSDIFNPNPDPNFVPHAAANCGPGALTPFGMVNLGPVTRDGGWVTGYSAHDTTTAGFAFMHTSGSGWSAEFGNLLTTATTGPLLTYWGLGDESVPSYLSAFDDAEATVGYYASTLTRYGIRAECTASPHCGVLRFTFPASDTSRIQSDLAYRITGSSDWQKIKVLNDSTIVGSMKYTPHTGGWGNGGANIYYNLHFYAVLSKPMTSWGFWKADIPEDLVRNVEAIKTRDYCQRVADAEVIRGGDSAEGGCIGFFTEFPTTEGEQVEMKVAFSFVDDEGALKNYEAEARKSSFDSIHEQARTLWAENLGKVRVKGGTETQKRIFYTALYHADVDPRVFTDVDGRFTAADGSIKKTDGYTRRTLFSGWDVFRSQTPLQTIVNPQLVDDLISSQIALAEESGRGYYNRWEMLNSYTGCMLGNPTNSVLADAWFKGIRGYDGKKALQCAVNSSNQPVDQMSLYPWEMSIVSTVLEDSYFDWCTAKLAEDMGDEATAKEMYAKSGEWKNWFNDDVHWFLTKDKEGNWMPAEGDWLTRWFYGTCECNLLQQGWFVPHDTDGLAEKLGGREAMVAKLDDFFGKTEFGLGWSRYYVHSNEPVHWVPFLYNRLSEPWKTQQWVRTILDKCYTDDVEGLVGNDDEGQMSAWYVLSAAGLAQACPGDNRVEVMSPIFEEVEFTLDPKYYSGKSFKIKAHGTDNPANVYIQKAELNGKPLNECWIDFSAISSGGTLELWLGSEPNKQWGI